MARESIGNGEQVQAREAAAASATVADPKGDRSYWDLGGPLEDAVSQVSGIPEGLLAVGRAAERTSLDETHGEQLAVMGGVAIERVYQLLAEDVGDVMHAATLEEAKAAAAKAGLHVALLDEVADGLEAIVQVVDGAAHSAAFAASLALRELGLGIEAALDELHAALTGQERDGTTGPGLVAFLRTVLDGLDALALPEPEREAVGADLACLRIRIRRLVEDLDGLAEDEAEGKGEDSGTGA